MVWKASKHTGRHPNIQWVLPNIWGDPSIQGASKCMGAYGHPLSLTKHAFFVLYRWVPLKLDFLGAWKSVWLKHYPAYPVTIISLIIQRNLGTKIWAKWESGLTTVWLKWDPPVYVHQASKHTGGHPNLWGCPNIWGICKHMGGIQTYVVMS